MQERTGDSPQPGNADRDRTVASLGRRTSRPGQTLRAWRQVEVPVIVGLGITALVFGVIGFQRAGDEFSPTLLDSIFHSVQLFVLEEVVPKEDAPILLQIARFLAPFVAGYAAVRGFLAHFIPKLATSRFALPGTTSSSQG